MVAQIALLSDLHANAPALRAVLDDLDRREAARAFNAVYCLGDLGGYAAEPNEVQELIMALGCPVVLGNYDEGVGFDREDCGCRYTRPFEIAMSDISFRWTREHTTTEHKAWLRTLPREIRLEIGGYRVLLCHGSPRDTTEYLFENRSDGYLRQFTAGGRADAHAEARLGVGLPPTYRAFLMVSKGRRGRILAGSGRRRRSAGMASGTVR
jgi:predicted phosphodiesterase